MSPPSGTVTLLFTDIEGSTALWESHGKEMENALARHDELLRSEIETLGGYVFKTVGDAFCAAFRAAEDGLRAALGAQKALFGETFPGGLCIRVRMDDWTSWGPSWTTRLLGGAALLRARALPLRH